MQKTPVALYRMGNASSPRMGNIRTKDVQSFETDENLWVSGHSGGISTFSIQGAGKNWWYLEAGTAIPEELFLVNDW